MAGKFRCVLEVLRFLPAQATLRTASRLSSTWRQAADSEELWSDYCDLYEIEPEGKGRVSYKAHFRRNNCGPKSLPILTKTDLLLYALPSLEKKTVELSRLVSADRYTAYCFLDLETLMACGANRCKRDAYKIGVNTGIVTRLSPMCTARHSSSLFKYKRIVYCFGGFTRIPLLKSIERYSLEGNIWTETEHNLIASQAAMNPTRYRSLLYLTGVMNIDVFDLRTEEVRPFPLSLPRDCYCCFAHATAEGELVLVHRDSVMRCSLLNTPDHFDVKPIEVVGNGLYWSNCPSVKVGNRLFSVYNSHGKILGILQFDLNTDQLKRVRKVKRIFQ